MFGYHGSPVGSTRERLCRGLLWRSLVYYVLDLIEEQP